jgi:hypothetical protein
MTDPSGYDAEAVSVLEYGGGDPGYIAPGQAQLVQDTQKTWLMQWPRDTATSTTAVAQSPAAAGAPPPGLALADPSEPDVPDMPSGFAEFSAGFVVGTLVGITPFGTMVDPVRNNPQLGNHTNDYLFGKAGGEFAGGIALMHLGVGVSEGGAALVLTGEGSMYGGAAVFAGGGMTVGGLVNSASGMQQLLILMMSGGAPRGPSEKSGFEARSGGSSTTGETAHGQQRADEAGAGNSHRQVGDANRVVRQGRQFVDTETGAIVNVDGNRVVITNSEGKVVTQFKNSRANTQQRIQSGKWKPVEGE